MVAVPLDELRRDLGVAHGRATCTTSAPRWRWGWPSRGSGGLTPEGETWRRHGVRWAVGIPQTWTAGGIDRPKIRRFLERADALGFESAWVVEQVLGAIPSLDAVELLAWAAAVTERIRLGTAVLLTPIRSPVHLAKSLATVDQLSGGRLDVGVGMGGNAKVYPAYGITPARRVARFNEGISADACPLDRAARDVRRASSGSSRTPRWSRSRSSARTRRSGSARITPTPFAGRFGGTWGSWARGRPPRRRSRGRWGSCGASSRRRAAILPPSTSASASTSPSTATGIAPGAGWPSTSPRSTGVPKLAAEVSVWGSADQCVAGLREITAAGARLLMLNPVFDELEQLEILAAEGRPRLTLDRSGDRGVSGHEALYLPPRVD